MPSSYPNTPADSDPLNSPQPITLTPPDFESSNFDRSIIGIPAEDDEFNRGLIFLFDPSTGQPSIHSTSRESEDFGEPPVYEPSMSSKNTSSHRINTPQSDSDASAGLESRFVSSQSVDSPSSEHYSSVSARASLGDSEAAASSKPSWTSSDISIAVSPTAMTVSPAVALPVPGHFGPVDEFNLEQTDIEYLEDVMRWDDPSQSGNHAGLLNGPSQSEDAQGLEPKYEDSTPRASTRTTTVVMRTPKGAPPRTCPMGPRVTTKNKSDKAQAIEKAKRMRQIGVCLPCLVNHEPCDPGEICPKCLKGSSRIQKTPCVRPHLSKAVLFRIRALSFPSGVPEPKALAVTGGNKSLVLYNVGLANTSVAPETRPRLTVGCRAFPEIPGIRSVKSWIKGTSKINIHLPNFAMAARQRTETAKNLDVLLETGYQKLVTELATGQDDIVSLSLEEAERQAPKCPPIKSALQLSIISRLASKSFNICGQETLGIQQQQDPECPYYGRRPIPPLLDAQIDALLMDKMDTLKKSVLSDLRRMIAGQGRKHWYKIFLTMLVLLLNLEFVYQNQCRQMQRYQERNQQQDEMLQSWEDAAQNLILHFRAVCRGHIPLNMIWSKADQDAAEVDDRSLHFIEDLSGVAQSRADELLQRSDASPGTPLAWISALFVPQEKV